MMDSNISELIDLNREEELLNEFMKNQDIETIIRDLNNTINDFNIIIQEFNIIITRLRVLRDLYRISHKDLVIKN